MSLETRIPGERRSFRLLTVLDRMMFVDLLKTVTGVLSALVLIIVSQKFVKVLAQALEGNVANDTVLTLLGLRTVLVTTSFLPAAIFMSVLLVLGRMYKEQEIAAIASAGGGMLTLYRGIFLLLIPMTLIAAGLSMYAAPWAEEKTQELMNQDRQTADIRGISAGRFKEYSNGELIFYAEKIDNQGWMHKIFVQNLVGGKTGVVSAESGRLKNLPGGLYLVLENGERHVGLAGHKNFTLETFQEYAVLIDQKPSMLNLSRQAVETRTLVASNELRDIAEMQNRLNTPMGVILLAFIGVPLAKLSPRGGIYGSLLIAFGIYFIYGNLQRLNFSWVIDALMPSWVGYVWLNGLLLLIGMLLLLRTYGLRWLLQNLRKMWSK